MVGLDQNAPLPEPPADIEKPPDNIHTVLVSTANHVVRLKDKGDEFENMILTNHGTLEKFGFLHSANPHNRYYKWLVNYLRNDKKEANEPIDFIEAVKKSSEAKQSGSTSTLQKPDDYEFIVEVPEMNPVEMEVIKLTAQFVARNGKQFYLGLISREQKNPQFDFLKPMHYLNYYYNMLVQHYTRCIFPEKAVLKKLEDLSMDKGKVLDRVLNRAEWARVELKNKKSQEEAEAEERVQFAQIDWHDFVVVETITFTEDDLAFKRKAPPPEEAPPPPPEPEEDMEMEMEVEVVNAPTNIRIRNPQTKADSAADKRYGICPLCSRQIPLDELEKHVHIESQDPRFIKEKEALMKRKQEMSTDGSDVNRMLRKFFVNKRSDIFGTDEVEIGQEVGQEKRQAKSDKAIWDGHASSAKETTQYAISEQIAALHKKVNEREDESNDASIGPARPQSGSSAQAQQNLNAGHQQQQQQQQQRPPMPPQGMMPPPGMLPPPGMMPHHGLVLPQHFMPPMMPGFPLHMMPPAAPMPMNFPQFHPPPPADEPSAKKQKLDDGQDLIPEEEFLKANAHLGTITLPVVLPLVDKNDLLNGQTISVTAQLTDTIATVKERIQEQVQLPVNKQKLKADARAAVFKDTHTVAFYNLTNGMLLSLALKERGGRKK